MTEGENFIEKATFYLGHRSPMSNSAWCYLKKDCTVLKVHDMCHKPKCNCQKQITFTPHQFRLEGNGYTNTMEKMFKGTEKKWNNFNKLGWKIASPNI